MANNRIITCAITGSSHTPSMFPHLPYKTKDIIRQSIDAYYAGASVIHLHARNNHDGSSSADSEIFHENVESTIKIMRNNI